MASGEMNWGTISCSYFFIGVEFTGEEPEESSHSATEGLALGNCWVQKARKSEVAMGWPRDF